MKSNSLEAALARPKLAFHDYLPTISKIKPKIRIIHLVEPEIIKATVQEFQGVVQRLTGKPGERKQSRRKGHEPKPYCIKTEGASGGPVLHEAQRMKMEVEGAEDQSVLAGLMEDMDGFFDDVNGFPMFSLRSSQMNIFGEMPLC